MRRIAIYIIMAVVCQWVNAQINVDQVMRIGQNALYFNDYVVSIQYFNLAIQAKPDQAKPYYYRAIAKLYLEDFLGAEQDATLAIERNPFLKDVWEIRAVARQNLGKNNEAIADYEVALRESPANKQILFNKAMAHEAEKDFETAHSTFGQLIAKDASNDRAYRGRAQLWLSQGDTAKAIADLDTAIALNANEHRYRSMRAYLNALTIKDYETALADMDEAIRLHAQDAEYYIFRAQLRYNVDNYDGALDDYTTAISIDPDNYVAHYNRGILRTEINDLNHAIEDYSEVLRITPNDYRTLYNRAILYRNIHDFKNALADVSTVISVMPDFPVAYFLRFEIYQKMGNEREALKDYDKAVALVKRKSKSKDTRKIGDPFARAIENDDPSVADVVDGQFQSLLPVEPARDIDPVYSSKDLMGAIQDRDVKIEPQPMMVLTYYFELSELQLNSVYVKEIDEINASRALRFEMLTMANAHQALADAEAIANHVESVDYYNSFLSTHNPRAIDYFGRALDFYMLRDYDAVIIDIDRAVALASDFALAYFLRALARYENIYLDGLNEVGASACSDGVNMGVASRYASMMAVVDDFNKVIGLSPSMAAAYYNKGNVLLAMQNYVEAIDEYSKAIELESLMGEAFYNRGYAHLKMGNKEAAVADISKSGELGVVTAYNLLKTISKENK